VNLDARHQAAREWRLEDVEEAGSGHADEDDLVLEHCRIDVGRLLGEQLLLRIQEIEERIM